MLNTAAISANPLPGIRASANPQPGVRAPLPGIRASQRQPLASTTRTTAHSVLTLTLDHDRAGP